MSDIDLSRYRRDERNRAAPPDQGQGLAAFLGRVTSASPVVGEFMLVQPASVVGDEAEGSAGTVTDAGVDDVAVYLPGPGTPATDDEVICQFANYRWVASKLGAGVPVDPCEACIMSLPSTLKITVPSLGISNGTMTRISLFGQHQFSGCFDVTVIGDQVCNFPGGTNVSVTAGFSFQLRCVVISSVRYWELTGGYNGTSTSPFRSVDWLCSNPGCPTGYNANGLQLFPITGTIRIPFTCHRSVSLSFSTWSMSVAANTYLGSGATIIE